MNLEQIFKQAGVGAGPAAQEAATGRAPVMDEDRETEREENVMSNFIPFNTMPVEEGDEEEIEDASYDPRDEQIERLMALVTQLTERQNQPIQIQQVPQQVAQAPVNFMDGYDPVDAVERLLADPNAAINSIPAMRQQAQTIEALQRQLQQVQGYIQEQQYLQKYNVTAEDKDDHFEVMRLASSDQQELLRLAAMARKTERLEAAKAAEGLKAPKRRAALSSKEQMMRLENRQRAMNADPVNSILAKFAARQSGR